MNRLIAESGATSTNWVLLKGKEIISLEDTHGLHPAFISDEKVSQLLESVLTIPVEKESIRQVFVYTAGSQDKDSASQMKKEFQNYFLNAEIYIESDVLAAARSLFGSEEGVVAILGTGSNVALYNGQEMSRQVLSLGYILGDEGSGAYLGKNFLQKLMVGKLSKEIEYSFQNKYSSDYRFFIHELYHADFPSRYLASFLPFIIEHKSDDAIKRMIFQSMDDFFKNYLFQIPELKIYKLGFCGSVAHILRDELIAIAEKYHLKIDKILPKPIHELVKYHLEGHKA